MLTCARYDSVFDAHEVLSKELEVRAVVAASDVQPSHRLGHIQRKIDCDRRPLKEIHPPVELNVLRVDVHVPDGIDHDGWGPVPSTPTAACGVSPSLSPLPSSEPRVIGIARSRTRSGGDRVSEPDNASISCPPACSAWRSSKLRPSISFGVRMSAAIPITSRIGTPATRQRPISSWSTVGSRACRGRGPVRSRAAR